MAVDGRVGEREKLEQSSRVYISCFVDCGRVSAEFGEHRGASFLGKTRNSAVMDR